MHARTSEREDRLMNAHARDECARRDLFSLIVGTIIIISTVSNRRCPWKLELYVSCAFLDR